MIPLDETIETPESKPLARRFKSSQLARAYILGLEDGKRALGAQRILGHDPWLVINTLWLETKEFHSLDIMDPPDREYVENKTRG